METRYEFPKRTELLKIIGNITDNVKQDFSQIKELGRELFDWYLGVLGNNKLPETYSIKERKLDLMKLKNLLENFWSRDSENIFNEYYIPERDSRLAKISKLLNEHITDVAIGKARYGEAIKIAMQTSDSIILPPATFKENLEILIEAFFEFKELKIPTEKGEIVISNGKEDYVLTICSPD